MYSNLQDVWSNLYVIVTEFLDILLPIITRISNEILKAFKLAAVTPIITETDLIAELLHNVRPILNLPFLSTVMEKVAAKQLITHKELFFIDGEKINCRC